ncbi:MAG: hypothetical protein PHG19_02500 [Anaerotignum sp.]|nr:hypothetical protein [Anaerotignum sp.]
MENLEHGNEVQDEDFFDEFEDDFEEGGAEESQEGEEEGSSENDDGAAAAQEGSGGDPNSEEGNHDSAGELAQKIEEASKQRFEEFFKRQYGGLVNPVTGQAVRNEAELIAYEQAMAENEYNRKMADAGIDPDILNNIIGNHPAVLAAQRMQQEQQAREAENFTKTQLGNLLAKYPDCGLTDLNQLEQSQAGKATLQDWGKTGDLVKAYTANFADEILQRRTAAAKQGKLNEINGKRHLSQPKGSGGGGESMSQEEYRTWKGFFPEASYEEIQKMWKENKEG